VRINILSLIAVLLIISLSSCSKDNSTNQNSALSEDSIKSLILAKENATLIRWYNGDPMGFIDNSWENVTYFDASLKSRADSINAFRNLLTPIIGQIHVPAHKLDKPLVRIYGDIALLTFTDILIFDKNNTGRWHATEIYQRRGNDWKLIHSHWTESKVK
jgi:Calcium/calmodulin dependent protein kinase II association domain